MSKRTKAVGEQAVAEKRGRSGATKPEGVVASEGGGEGSGAEVVKFSALTFRRRLGIWYRENARKLPWRGVDDPYATWLSEIMLQQTRVATVIDRYQEFLRRFPTIHDLAIADEEDVLALWSGLGYYRRARMLHRGAQFVDREFGGKLPRSEVKLRTLPGVGEYTAAAIASIAFGESVAVLDGNVERVLLRVLGQAQQKGAKARASLADAAQQPAQHILHLRPRHGVQRPERLVHQQHVGAGRERGRAHDDLPARRSRTALARLPSSGSVSAQPMQASVMDTPQAGDTPGLRSWRPSARWLSIITPVMRRSPPAICAATSAPTSIWRWCFFSELACEKSIITWARSSRSSRATQAAATSAAM